jgi:hypothetical protein
MEPTSDINFVLPQGRIEDIWKFDCLSSGQLVIGRMEITNRSEPGDRTSPARFALTEPVCCHWRIQGEGAGVPFFVEGCNFQTKIFPKALVHCTKTKFSPETQKRHSFIAQNQNFPQKKHAFYATRKDVESYTQMPGKRILTGHSYTCILVSFDIVLFYFLFYYVSFTICKNTKYLKVCYRKIAKYTSSYITIASHVIY